MWTILWERWKTMDKILRIKDCFSTGLFAAINFNFGDGMNSKLDDLYIKQHASNKIASPYVESFVASVALTEKTDIYGDKEYRYIPTFSSGALSAIGAEIYAKFSVNWTKLAATLTAEYDPLKNYDMSEAFSETGSNTGTVTDSGSDTGTVSHSGSTTHGETVTTDDTNNANTSTGVYGFNSATVSPSEESTGANAHHSLVTHGGSDGHSDTETRNLANGNTRTDNLAHSIMHTLTRSGNIGVTTSQQMLQSERDLWVWSFLDQVFTDIDSVLTCKIY